jgi:hypothetical protein
MANSDDDSGGQRIVEASDAWLDDLLAKVKARKEEKPARLLWRLWELRVYLAPLFAAGWLLSVYSFIVSAAPCISLYIEDQTASQMIFVRGSSGLLTEAQKALSQALLWYRETMYPFAMWHFDLLKLSPKAWMPDYLLAIYFSVGAAGRNAGIELSTLSTWKFEGLFPLLWSFYRSSWKEKLQLVDPILKAVCHALTYPVYLLVFLVTFPVREPVGRWINNRRKWFVAQHRIQRERIRAQLRNYMDTNPDLSDPATRETLREMAEGMLPDPDDHNAYLYYYGPIFKASIWSAAFTSVLLGMLVFLTIVLLIGMICR